MQPLEIHVYDLDGTLYDSPRLIVDRPDWWYSAKSLSDFGPPGSDKKWILSTVIEARRSIRAPWVRTALLTGRPLHGEMEAVIKRMLTSARLPFDFVQLKPLWPPMKTPAYKSARVLNWIAAEPSINKIVFYDDLPENLDQMGAMARSLAMPYIPVLAPGIT